MRNHIRAALCGTLISWSTPALVVPLRAQDTLAPAVRASIDSSVTAILERTGAPSASIAVVREGKIVYARAYGSARLEPKTPATPDMRYSIGSISKQFTAAAILLLAERGKLSLEDKVSRWLPDLTRADEITVRQLLSMTSGYQDYWPQDYVMPFMLQPTTGRQIVDTWAKKPLDFEPGSRWQYSNTNYVIAGMIVEQVAGIPLVQFLRQEIFSPLGMQSVVIADDGHLGPTDPEGYLHYALGPPRVAPKEGRGWLFAAGELAMTAHDLALWDIAVIDQRVLKPASYHEQQTTMLLTNGAAAAYGLGVSVGMVDGHRIISHGGGVSGYTTQNAIYPDDRAAVVALTNGETGAPQQIAARIGNLLFAANDPATQQATALARRIFEGLQHQQIDRTLFTPNANAYFNEQALSDFASSLGPLGAPTEVVQVAYQLRGGMTFRAFRVQCGQTTVTIAMRILPDGKVEQFQVEGG